MKIYVVVYEYYDSFEILRCFSKEETAKAFFDTLNYKNEHDIYEFILDES